MKTCHDYEIQILSEKMDDDLKAHLENCENCQMYSHLLKNESISFELTEFEINSEVNIAIETAQHIKHRKDIFATILFVCLAISITSFSIITLYDLFKFSVKHYMVLISSIMPLSLPILSIIRKKVVLR